MILKNNHLFRQTVDVMKAKSLHAAAKGASRFGDLVQRMDNDNVDLKITVMQLINALLSGGDEATQEEIKKLFNVNTVVEKLRKGQMKAALEVQLDIYDEMNADVLSTDTMLRSSSTDPSVLFTALVAQVKGANNADVLCSLLQHLMLVRGDGKSG